MLKTEFQHLNSPEVVDSDEGEYLLESSEKRRLSAEEREMLKNFLWHVNNVTNRPSEQDKKLLAKTYFEAGMEIAIFVCTCNSLNFTSYQN